MPICSLHLVSLRTAISDFLYLLLKSKPEPLVVSRVIRWVIVPESLSVDPLLNRNIPWDLLLILPGAEGLSSDLLEHVGNEWTVKVGIPSRLISGFKQRNEKLLFPKSEDVPPLSGALNQPRIAGSSQGLELTEELRGWIERFSQREGQHAVSMLNLLAFKPGMKDEYLKYGAEFAKSIGKRRGGNAKIVGNVIDDGSGLGSGTGSEGKVWDEIALAHYPSIEHFADMLASEDYQEVNHRHRVGSLKDTFILCTSELDLLGVRGPERL
ncbi:uncharacterized protein IWZ02DRAFT_378303 [Phyllosticta citriasiana]|uniref:DUF1330 domain-containing protein n=1 Tax=Phyllosticta citriasiana TaxID=595635 RepID=A0ABR1L087_9PEZI